MLGVAEGRSHELLSLQVKEAEGSHWLKREQPLPPLEERVLRGKS